MKSFEEHTRSNKVRKQRTSPARAKALLQEAAKRYVFIESLEIKEENANYIVENVYDVLRELIEAHMSFEGYKSYSHEANVAYLAEIDFRQRDVYFFDELRKRRHGVKYYGKNVKLDYARKTLQFLQQHYETLRKRVLSELAMQEDIAWGLQQ
ncbi:MAG: hypothetical protein OXR66_04220 [Candidatus Woesearchaeota archaeon]|nr:hypothetical protein [Candidatus Woesearchaeota archaeon]